MARIQQYAEYCITAGRALMVSVTAVAKVPCCPFNRGCSMCISSFHTRQIFQFSIVGRTGFAMSRHVWSNHSSCAQTHPRGRAKSSASPAKDESNFVSEYFAYSEKDAVQEWQCEIDETRTEYSYPGSFMISTSNILSAISSRFPIQLDYRGLLFIVISNALPNFCHFVVI